MTVTLYKWIDSSILAAENYLKDPTPDNSEQFRIAFNKIFSMVGSDGYSLRQIYGALSDRREQSLVAIALWSIGNKDDSRAVMSPKNPTTPGNNTFDQSKAYTRVRQLGAAPEACLKICSNFGKSFNEDTAGLLTVAIMKDFPDYASNELAMDLLRVNVCPKSPIEILVEQIDAKSSIPWRDSLGMIFEKLNFDETAFIEAVALKVPKNVSQLLANEILSLKGNFEATKFLAQSSEMTYESNFLSVIAISDSRKMAILRKLLVNNHHDEKYILAYLQTAPDSVESTILASIATNSINDSETRKILIDSLEKKEMHEAVVARCQSIGLENLDEFEVGPYYRALKKLKRIDLMFALIKTRTINDPSSIIQFLSKNRIRPWQDAFRIFQEQLELAEPEMREHLTDVFLKEVRGDELLEAYENNPSLPPKPLHEIALLKFDNGEIDESRDLLLANIVKKHSPSAAFFLDNFSSDVTDEKLLLLAAESSSKHKRLLAINLIKSDQKEEAAELLKSMALNDDEAAHILIYVLGINIGYWVDVLHMRSQSFASDRFAKSFSASGLKRLPASELETRDLHLFKMAKKLGVSQRRAKSGAFELESWPCNLALIHPISDDWGSSSCSIHRPDVTQFEKMELLRPLSSDFWDEIKVTLKSNTHPFRTDSGKFVAQNTTKQSLRKWQEEALQSWAAHGRQGIIEAATGSGKSRVGVLAALEAIDDGLAVLIVVPNRILQQQWIKDYFRQFWDSRELPIRTMGNEDAGSGAFVNSTRTLKPGTITVAVVNTVSSIERDFRQDSDTRVLLIVDEVHNFSSGRNRKILNEKFERRLGLTATLEVPTGRYPVISNYFAGHPIYEYGFSRAIEEEVISPYDLLMIRVPLSDAELQGYRLAYQEMIDCKNRLASYPGPKDTTLTFEQLLRYFKSTSAHSALIAKYENAFEESDRFLRDSDSKAKSIQSVASIVKARGYALVFCDLNTTCENVEIILKNQGVQAQVLNQSVPQPDREKYFSQFESGGIQALIAPKVLDEGIDIRMASIGIFAGTSRRKLQTIQRLGRVLRKHPDKHKPLIILPLGIDTEEDPKVVGNEDLSESTYADVYARAEIRKCFDNAQDSEIQAFLAQRQ